MARRHALLVLLVLTGCASARVQMEDKRVLVDVGMSGQEVVRRIGRPSKVFPVAGASREADQTVEVWAYTMRPPPELDDAVEFGLSAGALVLLAVATQSNDSAVLNIRTRGRGRCTFWVGFGPDGRVRGVTNLEEVR